LAACQLPLSLGVQLRKWARRIDDMRHAGHDVYAYFNNDGGDFAVRHALQLKKLLHLEATTVSQ
jgi:uncharacterized protein YecE (DUF72 family)